MGTISLSRMTKHILLVLGALSLLIPIALVISTPANAASVECNNTRETAYTADDPSVQLVVPEGGTCFVVDAVFHSLRAQDPDSVFIFGSNTGHGAEHNIMIDGATGSVVIGSEGCAFDPFVGNNLQVTDSHDVLICEVVVDNNLTVTGNDGRITVRDSLACDNVSVSRNLPYAEDASTNHRNPGTIRLIEVAAARHVFTKDNADRVVIRRDVTAFAMLPSVCREVIAR